MLTAMARSTIKFLKQQGQFNTSIAALVGCDRHTVARVLEGPGDPTRRRPRPASLDRWRAEVTSWLKEGIPVRRMLELLRQDPTTPYTGGTSTFYRSVAQLRAAVAAGEAPVIRFEGLPGEYVQWDWGEARVPLGGAWVRRVFLAGRLKYSRMVGVRWRTQMDLETLCRAQLEIVEGWGGVPWAWVHDNLKTVTLGREADGTPRWNPAYWRFATEVGFHPECCDPGAARQKGTVENLVKWVKSNFLPGRSFADDPDLAQQSLAWDQEKNAQVSQAHGRRPVDLWPAEQAAFGPLRTTAATYGLYRVATVNRESLVRVEGNQYSVPVGHLGQAVDVRLLRDEIRISRDGGELAGHPRLSGTGQRRREPGHYLPALTTRPRARLVLERERLCALGPEVQAYVAAISQRRRGHLAAELAACTELLERLGADGLHRAAAACLARGLCGAEYVRRFAGAEPVLALPALPDQAAVDRDLAHYEAFVTR
ncbi:MAG: IS21 family transposase [candidate division NC10 bacterium]|nr:IS21 family transposase [candidate division NC10 bacterium]